MNQLEAHVIAIELFRSHEPLSAEQKRALKVFEARHAILLQRHRYRQATIPADLAEEPLQVDETDCWWLFRWATCLGCMRSKGDDVAFCSACYLKLDPSLRKAFRTSAVLFPHAYNRAFRLLVPLPETRAERLAVPHRPHP